MATENLEKKAEVVQYLQDAGIPKCLENLLNNVVNICPDDLYGYMADYFAGLAKSPMIANVTASDIFSTRGWQSFQVNIQSVVHGCVQDVSALSAPVDVLSDSGIEIRQNKPLSAAGAKGKEPTEKVESAKPEKPVEKNQIHAYISTINNEISEVLKGCELCEQTKVDALLQNIVTKRREESKIVTKREATSPGALEETVPNEEEASDDIVTYGPVKHQDILTVSIAVAISATQLLKTQLFYHLYEKINGKKSDMFCLPIPVMTILSSGKRTPGKLCIIKDIVIFAGQHLNGYQALKHLTNVYQELELVVIQKSPANIISRKGSFTPAVDRPEQALDQIREAVNNAGLEYDRDINVGIRCCSNDVYDKDKQKYEFSVGAMKTTDELVHIYNDLCERYPEIKMIIDPVVDEDVEGRTTLHELIGEKCFIINEHVFLEKPDNQNDFEKHLPGLAIRLQDSPTVTKFMEYAQMIKEQEKVLVVSPNEIGNQECVVDTAVACQADFILFEPPVNMERTRKYNRLVEVERLLVNNKQLLQRQPLEPKLLIESPPPEENENTVT